METVKTIVYLIFMLIAVIFTCHQLILACKEKQKGNTLDAIYELLWAIFMVAVLFN